MRNSQIYKLMESLAEDCFAALGKYPPKPRALNIWAEMCSYMDTSPKTWIWMRDKILEMDNVNGNFGNLVKAMYANYRSEHGVQQEAYKTCKNCDKEMPGFFFAWLESESTGLQRRIIRCECNRDPNFAKMQSMNKHRARELGCWVMPEDYKGRSGSFEASLLSRNTGCKHTPLAGKVKRVIDNPPPNHVRPAHRKHLEENQLW